MADISTSSRRVIRNLVRYAEVHTIDHKVDCSCCHCKNVRSAKREEKKLTEIINANRKARDLKFWRKRR